MQACSYDYFTMETHLGILKKIFKISKPVFLV